MCVCGGGGGGGGMVTGQIDTCISGFQKHYEIAQRSESNFFMFLITNEGYLSQIALKNMQLIVDYTFHEPTFIVSYLYAFPLTFRS